MESRFHLTLASASPRRRELLSQLGIPFDVVVPTIPELDEVTVKLPPTQQAEALAYFKARTVWEGSPNAIHRVWGPRGDPRRWVLGADTLVALGGQILGKPTGREHAGKMLSALAGTRHAVITGVALLGPTGRRITSDTTFVTMRTLPAEEIEAYLDSGQWAGKAGAYGLQEIGDRFVEKVEGSFSNVMGLPLELLERILHEMCGWTEVSR